MKKRILSLALALTLFLGLSGCSCKHEWLDATCTKPVTCSKCGEAAGSPLGHTWRDATCIEPKTCSTCGATDGQPIDHQWQEATCTQPETCSVCGDTQGDAPLGHDLDKNGVCTVCGEAIGTLLTMGNYTQYLNFSLDWGAIVEEEVGAQRRGYVMVDIFAIPNPSYTYHNVEITYKLTNERSGWTQKSSTFKLDKLNIGKETRTVKAYALSTDGSYSTIRYGSFVCGSFDISIISITGYVLPVETSEQGS